MDKLLGKVALVTGAGNASGIGMGCCRALSQAGARVVATATTQSRADAQAQAIRDAGGEAVGVALDLAQETSVREAVAAVFEKFGRLDILVNNAADTKSMARDGSVLDLDVAAWDAAFAVNIRGAMLCCRNAIPHMLAVGGGSVINISSQAAVTGSWHAAYGATKAALNNLTLNIALVYGKQGVRANVISPGMIRSQNPPLPDAAHAAWAEQVLTPRLGLPSDIGALAAFLASDDAGYITGQVIAADGGILSHATWTSIPQW